MLDLKIAGGMIVDGTGSPGIRGDVGIRNGRIVALGKVDEAARETIDAAGRVVSPGFVDVHTHYDAQVFWDPTVSPSSYHGVTTIFGGFCGFSIAPLTEESGAYLMPMLARVEGMPLQSLAKGVPWNWTSFADYLSRFEGTLAINAGFMAGHSAIRRYVMGPRAVGEKATREDLEKMKALLRESIRGGALGFSTTLSPTHNDAAGNPVPSRHATREELLELYSVVSEFEGTVCEMVPGIAFTHDTYEILTQASLAAQRPISWGAITVDDDSPRQLQDIAAKRGASDYAREHGATVVALIIPRTPTARANLLSGFAFDALPGWMPLFKLPAAERIEKLKDPGYRAQLKAAAATEKGLLAPFTHWAEMKIEQVFSAANKKYEGRRVGEIAADEARDPFDVFVSIAIADDLRTSFMPKFAEETQAVFNLRSKLWADPQVVIGTSDAGAHVDMIDTFAIPTDVLSLAVRHYKVMTLEEAVHQLTQKPAELMGLKERGLLKLGWHADIVIFDADTIACGKLQMRDDLPAQGLRLYAGAEGIDHVIVNGREIIRGGKYLGVPAGIILRPGKDTYTVPIPAAKAGAGVTH